MPKSKFNAKAVKWRKQHTEILQRYYALMSEHPFSAVSHFTVTPTGNQVCKSALTARFHNTLTQCKTIRSVLYNYELSDAGVNHIHGIMLYDCKWAISPYFTQNQLVLLNATGGRQGWIKYMAKDKGKTFTKNRQDAPIQNYI